MDWTTIGIPAGIVATSGIGFIWYNHIMQAIIKRQEATIKKLEVDLEQVVPSQGSSLDKLGHKGEEGPGERTGIVDYWPSRQEATKDLLQAIREAHESFVLCAVTLNSIAYLFGLKNAKIVAQNLTDHDNLSFTIVLHLDLSGPTYDARKQEKPRDLDPDTIRCLVTISAFRQQVLKYLPDKQRVDKIVCRFYTKPIPRQMIVYSDGELWVGPYFSHRRGGDSYLLRLAATSASPLYEFYIGEMKHILSEDIGSKQFDPEKELARLSPPPG